MTCSGPATGTTIEVLNTDAEGRLVLADGLSWRPRAPDAIVDIATLTGAQRMALGNGGGGLLGNDDELVAPVRAAGARAGEPSGPSRWPGLRRPLDSDVADIRTSGRPGQAGAIAAALLLQEFVDGRPWAHLDIAGTGRSAESRGTCPRAGRPSASGRC